MRREHRFDAEPPQQRDDLLERHATRREPAEALLETARLRRAAVVHVLASAAHAVHLLGQVHDLEPGAERPYQFLRLPGRAALGANDQFDRRLGLTLPTADRGMAVTLDEVEERLPALVLQDLADEFAQRMHVVAQRGVLEREEDAFAGHSRVSRTVSIGG